MIKRFIKKLPIFFAVALVSSLLGYPFHFLMARYLGPSGYGKYSVLLALMFAFAQPLESLSFAVARSIAEQRKKDLKILIPGFMKVAFVAGLVLGIMLYGTSFFWQFRSYHYSQITLIYAGLTILLWSFMFVFRGITQGLHKEISFVLNRPIQLISRLFTGGSVILFKGGISTAIGASLCAAIGAILHLAITLKRYIGKLNIWQSNSNGTSFFFVKAIKILAMWLPVGLFIRLDMILAGKIFGPEKAGIYAIINLIGKGILFYSLAIIPLIYPYFVEHRMRKEGWRFMLVGIFYTSTIFCITFIFFSYFSGRLVPFLFGNIYQDAAKLLPYYIIAIFPIALFCNIINLKLAIGGWVECVFLWIGIIFYFLILYFSPADIKNYLLRIGISHLVLTAFGITFLIVRKKKHTLRLLSLK